MIAQPAVVHVVDDDDSFRTAVARLLGAAGYEVRTYTSSGDYLLKREPGLAGCLLLDLRMPGPSGIDLQQALAKAGEPLPIVFLSGQGDIATSVRAMKAGAVDFLTKPVDQDTLLEAVRDALVRGEHERALREQAQSWQQRYDRLTPREREVLWQVVAGKRSKQIATSLSASERTVKAHRAHIMRKMGATTVAELIRLAERWQTQSVPSTGC